MTDQVASSEDHLDEIENLVEDGNVENPDGDGNNSENEKHRRSSWWEHYEEIIVNGVSYAKCNYCPAGPKGYCIQPLSGCDLISVEWFQYKFYFFRRYKVSGLSNSTGNMKRHILKHHPEQVLETSLNEEEFVYSQENFRKTLVEWIALCDMKFNVVEKPAFQRLVRSLNPVAELISDKTVQADILLKFGEKMEALKDRLSHIDGKISITMDGWTSRNVLSFVAIRGHWLDKDWNYNTTLLDFSKIEGEHSGYKLKTIFEDCLGRYEIPFTKILGITVDNATNNDTFFNWLEEHGMTADVSQIRCLAHIMNLSVQDMLKCLKSPFAEKSTEEVPFDDESEDELENEELEDIDMNETVYCDDEDLEVESEDNEVVVVKLRKLIKKIRKSVQMRQKLQKCCEIFNIKYLVPIIDMPTRWNSTNDMIRRGQYLKDPLRSLSLREPKLNSLQITDSEWDLLGQIQTVLVKFERATKLVSMERHPTIAAYLPTFSWLTSTLTKVVTSTSILRPAARLGLAKLEKYRPTIETTKVPFFAIILHPALKTAYFKEHDYPASVIREIQKQFSNYLEANYELDDENALKPSKDETEDELYEFMFKRSKIDRRLSEFKKYLNLPLAPKQVNCLEFWKIHQSEYPLLSRMARDIFPIQSASVSVERDFSSSGRVVTPDRAALKPETIRAVMCVKSWLKD